MKRIILILAYFIFTFPLAAQIVVVQRVNLQANNLNAVFQNTGIFNQNTALQNQPGCEWPIGSGNHLCFTTGLTMAAMINDSLAYTCASYRGEYAPGTVVNGVYYTNSTFKIYSVKAGDNCSNNPDYANWGLMVPYGAPFKDVNQNGTYECGIDIPGMPDAKQTFFMCLTDANISQHSTGEGFGGGVTKPLFKSQVAITGWGYNYATVNNAQFIKYVITNKNNVSWKKTHLGLFSDPDIGDSDDDMLGCSPELDLGYAYNADNHDADYGANPPAFGFVILRSPFIWRNGAQDTLGLTSFMPLFRNGGGAPPCVVESVLSPQAYNYMRGFKNDGTPWMEHNSTPLTPTRYLFPGDPETQTGWTYNKGITIDCQGGTPVIYNSLPGYDVKMIMNTGSDSLDVLPNQKIEYTVAQFVERGTSNLNSVTLLKNRAASLKTFYNLVAGSVSISHSNEIIIKDYKLYQNYPNPFNPETNIKFDIPKTSNVQLEVFDISGKLVAALVNEQLNSGQYTIKFDAGGLSSGIYVYRMRTGDVVYSNKMLLLK
ncbi:MAG TPA: T9SS type A sorting domain-containing protein [Ignavibacteria bacterium]|nr:T9SS type A sorting domain-containing protein [Ignavibacteria bacterium]